jgi:hypothetical protein
MWYVSIKNYNKNFINFIDEPTHAMNKTGYSLAEITRF